MFCDIWESRWFSYPPTKLSTLTNWTIPWRWISLVYKTYIVVYWKQRSLKSIVWRLFYVFKSVKIDVSGKPCYPLNASIWRIHVFYVQWYLKQFYLYGVCCVCVLPFGLQKPKLIQNNRANIKTTLNETLPWELKLRKSEENGKLNVPTPWVIVVGACFITFAIWEFANTILSFLGRNY